MLNSAQAKIRPSQHQNGWWHFGYTRKQSKRSKQRRDTTTFTPRRLITPSLKHTQPVALVDALIAIDAIMAVEDLCLNLGTSRGDYVAVKIPGMIEGNETYLQIMQIMESLPFLVDGDTEDLRTLMSEAPVGR